MTTGCTANACHRRRKQDANFACTVPCCGSTFTRGLNNLNGHLRSHFEEKPYNLIGPDVGKGLLDDMINDMNNCTVISNRLSVRETVYEHACFE